MNPNRGCYSRLKKIEIKKIQGLLYYKSSILTEYEDLVGS